MKELAKQTGKATEDIGLKISAIPMDTQGAASAIETVSNVIHRINDISATIATAVKQQGATTSEMTRNASEAVTGTGEISARIGGVAQSANGTSTRAQESEKAAPSLASIASQLGKLMAQFKIERRDPRIATALHVQLTAADVTGQPIVQEVITGNISRGGALLKGVRGKLRPGTKVSLAHHNKQEEFEVQSAKGGTAGNASEIGVASVNSNSSFWDETQGGNLNPKMPRQKEIIRRRFWQSHKKGHMEPMESLQKPRRVGLKVIATFIPPFVHDKNLLQLGRPFILRPLSVM